MRVTEPGSLQMSEPLFLAPRHRATLLHLLHRRIPESEVWAFGSRATGRHVWRFSDLDLAVENISWAKADALQEDLIESDLPILVDVVSLDRVEDSFRKRICRDFVPLRQVVPA